MPLSSASSSTTGRLDHLRRLVDGGLASLVVEADPPRLYDPVRYVLAGQGKRVRSVLLLLVADVFGVEESRALPAALSVEVFHNFTLVHDDIMDHAAERRGRPTVHVRWDEDTALLCGDYLLSLSYDLLARLETDALPTILHRCFRMVARLCEGQTLDKDFETRKDVTVDAYLGMVDAKTGALLEASLEFGGMLGRADDVQLQALGGVGRHVGRAFQIQDDLLDLVAEDERWGKPIGGDLMEGKKTYLLLTALERTTGDDHSWFARIIDEGGLPAESIGEARARMAAAGVLEAAREAVLVHTETALGLLTALPSGEARDALAGLIRRMQARLH